MTQLALNFEAARSRGDLGAERAANKAERAAPGWIDAAAERVRDFTRHNLLGMTGEFTVETAREWAASMGFKAPDGADARAWGHVTRLAVRLGYIEPTGGYAPAASSNGSPKRLYRKCPKA